MTKKILCLLELSDIRVAADNLSQCERILDSANEEPTTAEQRSLYENLRLDYEGLLKTRSRIDELESNVSLNADPLAMLPVYELQHFEDYFDQLVQPAARLRTQGLGQSTNSLSKFGGTADRLPLSRIPRSRTGELLPLLMQIKLDELATRIDGMPVDGMLYFFFDPNLCKTCCANPTDPCWNPRRKSSS